MPSAPYPHPILPLINAFRKAPGQDEWRERRGLLSPFIVRGGGGAAEMGPALANMEPIAAAHGSFLETTPSN